MTDQRLWIAVHLLYPNSSQALDIYYTILNSLPKDKNSEYRKLVFIKLESFFFKTPTVRSGQPFRVFETSNVTLWNILYKKSLKENLLVIIGLIVFDFTLAEVSELLKLTEEKARFLVNQAFKRISDLSIDAPAVELNFKFKKAVDQKVTYFFTNENLIEYCLNIYLEKDKKLVEQGLLLYPQLKELQKKYIEVIDELNRVINAENLIIQPHPLAPLNFQENSTLEKKGLPNFYLSKNILFAGLISVGFITFIVFRPQSINNFLSRSSSNSIKIHEVNSQPREPELISEKSQPISLHEMPIESKTKKALMVGAAKSNENILTKKDISVAEKKSIAKVRQGGLYRGVILVSDLETVSDRITEKLVALGGKKAGEVELGWRKSPHVAYYHLTIPEGSVSDVKDFLKNFGQLKLEFENHPRLMPVGLKRMILEVKEIE